MTLATMALSLDPGQALDLPDRLRLVFGVSRRAGDPILPKDAKSVSSSRRCIRGWLRGCGVLPLLIEDTELLLTELVTNAIEHGTAGEIEIYVISTRNSLTLSVRDGSHEAPRPQAPDADAEWGRGLLIVEAITSQHGGTWGTSTDNTTTWCTISSPAEQSGARLP